MSFLQNSDPKKEDFRRYLEKNGIIDSLTRVLVDLYEEPEKPDSPAEFIRQQLGQGDNAETLKQENENLKTKIQEMQSTIDRLNGELAKHASTA